MADLFNPERLVDLVQSIKEIQEYEDFNHKKPGADFYMSQSAVKEILNYPFIDGEYSARLEKAYLEAKSKGSDGMVLVDVDEIRVILNWVAGIAAGIAIGIEKDDVRLSLALRIAFAVLFGSVHFKASFYDIINDALEEMKEIEYVPHTKEGVEASRNAFINMIADYSADEPEEVDHYPLKAFVHFIKTGFVNPISQTADDSVVINKVANFVIDAENSYDLFIHFLVHRFTIVVEATGTDVQEFMGMICQQYGNLHSMIPDDEDNPDTDNKITIYSMYRDAMNSRTPLECRSPYEFASASKASAFLRRSEDSGTIGVSINNKVDPERLFEISCDLAEYYADKYEVTNPDELKVKIIEALTTVSQQAEE